MFDTLKTLKDGDKEADFLFSSLPAPVKGKVKRLSKTRVVIQSRLDGDTFEYITHPHSVWIVQKKA